MDKCKEVREKILDEVSKEIKNLKDTPKLAIVKCNNDFGSEIYIRNKVKTCESVGIKVKIYDLNPETTTLEDIVTTINIGNYCFHGTILQLPLADKFKQYEKFLLNQINPCNDIDGLTDVNKLKLINNEDCLVPCTALAVFKIMEHELGTTDFSGKKVCIVNRSDLIGKPLSYLLLNHNASPMICHSKTEKDINNFLYYNIFDIIVTGIGKHIIDEYYISGSLIIDCGISKDENNKLLRDVIRSEYGSSKYYGKVGTVTCACVAYNTLKAYKFQN